MISNDIVGEYVEKIEEKTTAIIASNIGEFLVNSSSVEKIEIHFKWQIVDRDKDDNKFVDCALNGKANFLVTDDRHYRILKKIKFPPIEIIRTAEFLKKVQELK